MTDPLDSERLTEAVAILVAHNRWRRCDDGSTPSVNVYEIGQAIDIVGELVPLIIAKKGK